MTSKATPTPRGAPVTTRWSVVVTARDGDGSRAATAMAALCEAYWYPIYAYIRRQGTTVDDAADLTQGFFASLLATDFLAGVDRSRGRFRAFLLASCRHYLSNQRDHDRALKRGGGVEPLSLEIDVQGAEDRYEREPADDAASPERLFERQYALTLLERTLTRLEEDVGEEGRGELGSLLPFLNGDDRTRSYRDVAERLGVTEGALRVRVHRLRRRYGELLRAEIAETVGSRYDVDDELGALFEALGSS